MGDCSWVDFGLKSVAGVCCARFWLCGELKVKLWGVRKLVFWRVAGWILVRFQGLWCREFWKGKCWVLLWFQGDWEWFQGWFWSWKGRV